MNVKKCFLLYPQPQVLQMPYATDICVKHSE